MQDNNNYSELGQPENKSCLEKAKIWCREKRDYLDLIGRPIPIGIYFQQKRYYFHWHSFVLTIIMSLTIFVCLIIFPFREFLSKSQYFNEIKMRDSNNVLQHQYPQKYSMNFIGDTNLSFSIEAFNYENYVKEPIACSNVNLSVVYNVPNRVENTKFIIESECKERNGTLFYQLFTNKWLFKDFIEKSHFISVDAWYTGPNFQS